MVPLLLGIDSNFGTCTYQCSLSNFNPISLHMLKYIFVLKCIIIIIIIIIIIHETSDKILINVVS